jgi:tetratricopeptide (TPR) repeat protein
LVGSAHDSTPNRLISPDQLLRAGFFRSLLDLTDSANESERCRLLLALGQERCRAGIRSEAKSTFADAAALARALGAPEDLANAALGVAPGFLAVEVGVTDPFLEDLLQESLDNLAEKNPPLRARLAARLAMALHWTDAHERMRESISLARCLAEEVGDPAVSLDVDFARWFCDWNHASFIARDEIARDIQLNADLLRNREMSLIGTMLRQVGMLERGDTAAFDVSLESFSAMAAKLRQPYSLWYETLYRSMRAQFAGEYSLVPGLLLQFQAIASRVQDANAMNSLIMQNSFFRWETDELEPMIVWISEGARRSPTLQGFRAALAWANCKVGRLPEARREFEALASARFLNFPQRFDWPISIALCAEVCSDFGDASRAQWLYELLKPLESRFVVLGLGVLSFGSAARLLGRLAETMGRVEEAEAQFRVALERNAAAGAHAWTAHTKFDYALFLARTGGVVRRDYRVRLACEALETAKQLGMVNLRRRVESFLENAREREA